ncbi:sensor histidine kinase [Streptomyces xiamenensis]|uniref:sensor histidine kinase n=1 Tax=Streptomyces xiamenensis TaxID=408015 RepID=UPI0036E830DB
MTTAESDLDRRWATVLRRHPYWLLATATLLSMARPELTPATGERVAVGALIVAALVLQLWWGRARRSSPGPDTTSAATYFVLRWAISVALTWLAPFFAFYAAAGYIDNNELFSGRRRRQAGAFASSLTVAAAQSGGMPFQSSSQWAVFAGLLLANNALLYVITYFVEHEEIRSAARAATIAELERTNTALQQALDENVTLQAQLLVQAREAGVDEERRRLAAEIHDTLAQGLAGIIAQLRVVSSTPDPATAREHVDRAADLARHSLGEARRSVRNLAPVGLVHDTLPQALRKTVARWTEQSGIPAAFTLTGQVLDMPGEHSATLLRMTQEALTNVAKHAAADRVGVTLSYMDGEVTLDVRDNGRGFASRQPPQRTGAGGFGLEGMRSRAERVAGSLTVESEPGHGTAISIRLPLAPTEQRPVPSRRHGDRDLT